VDLDGAGGDAVEALDDLSVLKDGSATTVYGPAFRAEANDGTAG
jgi:hypothetical protein